MNYVVNEAGQGPPASGRRYDAAMGIGFVLLFWAILGVICATVAAVFLAGIVYLVSKRQGKVQFRWLLLFAAAPYVFLVYGAVAFVVYAVWCEDVRHVDPGIGDTWYLPVVNGYDLVMIDTPEQAYLQPPPREHASQLPLSQLQLTGRFIAGRDESEFFLLDTITGSRIVCASEECLKREMASRRLGPLSLEKADDFYFSRRVTAADTYAVLIAAAFPTFAFAWLVVRFVRRRRDVAP